MDRTLQKELQRRIPKKVTTPRKHRPVSIRQAAKRLDCHPETLRDAISDGRIPAALVAWVPGKRGQLEPKIADLDAAAAAWRENTRPRELAAAPASAATTGYQTARATREAETASLQRLKREAAELELAARRGELVPVAEVKAALAEEYAAVKSKLRAIPSRAKAEIPHLTPADVGLLKRLIDEALAELADEDVAAEEH